MQLMRNSSSSMWKTSNHLCLFFVAFLIGISTIVPNKVTNSSSVFVQLVLAGMIFWVSSRCERFIRSSLGIVLLQTARIVGLSSFLFQIISNFQHVIVEGWMDHGLLSVEQSITGVEASVFLQKYIHPILTEGLMFAYVMYIPLLPLVAIICYWSKGVLGAADYLLNLTMAFLVCYLGFILYPLASPMYHQPGLYTVGLEGGLFTWCAEWIRHNQHYAGGSLPSTHCAAATVMISMLFRHNRRVFFVLLPTLLIIFAATVYGRFHYAWDGIVAILAAGLSTRWSGHIVTAIEQLDLLFSPKQSPSQLSAEFSERD